MRIILSRTDSLGDVMLTLPMAGVIKRFLPESKLLFLGTSYTQPLAENCHHIDEFYQWEQIRREGLRQLNSDAIIHVFPKKEIASAAMKAGVKIRIGTSHRLYHWLTCNKLVSLGRKNSDLHEAQLNIRLLKPLGIEANLGISNLHSLYGWKKVGMSEEVKPFISPDKFNLIFHAKSKGSALDWDMKNYYALAQRLQKLSVNLIMTGTSEEGVWLKKECPEIFELKHLIDATGKLDLRQLISLIQHCDGLLACSTGPLHIAAASGIHCLGLYSAKRPLHPARWAPLGKKAEYLEDDGNSVTHLKISVDEVDEKISAWMEVKPVEKVIG